MNKKPINPAAIQDELLQKMEQRLPTEPSDPAVRACAAEKVARLRAWMTSQRLDAVLISRRDNFAWLTAGGDSHVLKNSETGSGHLLLTRDQQYLLAYSMDGERLLEEQLPGQGYALVMTRWLEGDPRQKAFSLAGEHLAADAPLSGTRQCALEINRLHDPLSDLEMERSRWLGRQTGLLLEALARWVEPGMLEAEIAGQMQSIFALKGIDLDVILVGSDERLARFRHAMPSHKPLRQFALIHPAARRWGLHANVCRMISFGMPPESVLKAHQAATTIESRLLRLLQAGAKFSDILESQKTWYAELGYANDFELHFQGGPTGYVVGDPTRALTDMCAVTNQAYDWFLTVGGIQVEELSLLNGDGEVELASRGKDWPLVERGELQVPGMWIM